MLLLYNNGIVYVMAESKYPDVPYVNEFDVQVGQGQMRDARAQGLIVRASRLILREEDNHSLLQQRSMTVNHPGTWDTSSDGYVDIGRGYEATAIDETSDELGLTGLTEQELAEAAHYLFLKYSSELPDEWTKLFTADYEQSRHGIITPNEEVAGVLWMPDAEIDVWVRDAPQEFEPGFPMAWQRYRAPEN